MERVTCYEHSLAMRMRASAERERAMKRMEKTPGEAALNSSGRLAEMKRTTALRGTA